MSTATFNNIDFEYTGNTAAVQHLIKTANNANRHPSQLNFELNLRTYRNNLTFKGTEPWQYPQAKLYYDPVSVDKPAFGHAHQLTKTSKIVDAKQAPKGVTDHKSRQNLGNYLSTDPQNKKYTDKYRVKNVNELKLLLKKGATATDQATLNWTTGLRPNLGNNSAWSLKDVPRTPLSVNQPRRVCYCPPKF